VQIGDYLLGQRGSFGERLRTRSYLDGSAEGRAWARAIAAELAPIAETPLPDLGEPEAAAENGIPNRSAVHAPADSDGVAAAPARDGATTPGDSRPAPLAALPSSRRGGAILLAVLALLVGGVIALVLGLQGGSAKHGTATGSPAKGATGRSASGAAKEDRRITLTSPNPSSRAVGAAEVLSEGSQYAFYLYAEHLPPTHGFFYAVWLYNSPSSHEPLSRAPSVGSNGRTQGGALLPANAGRFRHMIVTRETSERPTKPGPIVLEGDFALH
jgi:hypothetical protein